MPKADVVICDVVCSGFGIIRRKPEIKYKTPEEISRLPEIQYNILSNSSLYVKDGGTLVYSTCTVNQKENEEVVSRFINEHKDFKIVVPNKSENKYFQNLDTGCITLFGDDNNADGFFICKMKKVSSN
jgi:16S rRNA (cytosine967-C5)-methyltransferase